MRRSVGHRPRRPELDLARRIIDAGHRHVAITASRHPLATTLHARTATFLTEFVVAGVTTSIVTEDAAQGEAFENGLRQALDEGATAIVAGSGLFTLYRESRLARAERIAQSARTRPRGM